MRKVTVSKNGYDWGIEFPDNVVFAFNPLFIIVKTSPVNLSMTMDVVCNDVTRSINIKVFNGSARIYFSRIIQLFFEDYKHFRTLDFTVDLNMDEVTVFSTTFMAIWGSLALGERYNAYGLFNFNGKTEYERTRIWFRKFPFKVSMFSINLDPQIYCESDGKTSSYTSFPSLPSGAPTDTDGEWRDSEGKLYRYDAMSNEYYLEDIGNGREQGIFEVDPARIFPNARVSASLRIGGLGAANVFDDTFDYTFYQNGLSTHVVNLVISNETAGYYLRWIDSLGEVQYFLFTNKIVSHKNTPSSDYIQDLEQAGPMLFPEHKRRTQIKNVRTCKCSAVSLPRGIYEYVSTIVNAPIVDLYLGKSAGGRELWVPVNIVSATYDFDTTRPLNDLTLSFTLPEYQSQTL